MLYIVGTPIGNVEDTSIRSVKTLTQSDIILTEDRATFDSYYKRIQKLFKLFSKKEQKIIHFHKENEFKKVPWVIDQLKQEKNISLVSESGLPTISDPGCELIIQAIKSELPYTVIPGPTALTTAAVVSGFPINQLLFLGFIPKKKSRIVHLFKQIYKNRSKNINPTVVFYESPHRINQTLKILSEVLPCADVAICREMTKKFEEIVRGTPEELYKKNYKGEITVIIKLEI